MGAANTYRRVCAPVLTHTHAHTHRHTHAHTHTHTHTQTRTRTHTHARTHTYTHTCRPSRGSPQEHAQRLRQCDVANVGQGRDDQTLLHAQVLVRVFKVDVTDGDDDGVFVLAPVEAHLSDCVCVCVRVCVCDGCVLVLAPVEARLSVSVCVCACVYDVCVRTCVCMCMCMYLCKRECVLAK